MRLCCEPCNKKDKKTPDYEIVCPKKHSPTIVTEICSYIYDNKVNNLSDITETYNDDDKNIQHHIKIALCMGNVDVIEYLYAANKMKNIEVYHDCAKHINSFDFFNDNKLLTKIKNKYTLLLNIIENDQYYMDMWNICYKFKKEISEFQKNNLIMKLMKKTPSGDILYIINDIILSTKESMFVDSYLFRLDKINQKELKMIFKLGFYNKTLNETYTQFTKLCYIDLEIKNNIQFTTLSPHIKHYYKRLFSLLS